MHSITRELLAYLEEQRSVLKSAFESVPPEARDLPPAPERWSAANVVEHLAIVEGRISRLLSERIEEARAGLSPGTSADPILPTIDYKRMYDRSIRVKAPETAIPTGLDAGSAWTALESAGAKDAGHAYRKRWSRSVAGYATRTRDLACYPCTNGWHSWAPMKSVTRSRSAKGCGHDDIGFPEFMKKELASDAMCFAVEPEMTSNTDNRGT
jgi:hypothetical protein